jgi:hypothetical protein
VEQHPTRTGILYGSIYILEQQNETTSCIIGKTVQLIGPNIGALCGRRTALVGGGPPGSGKNTLAAYLVPLMNNIVKSLTTRPGWETFDLKVGAKTLDLGTPTLRAISDYRGHDQNMLNSVKKAWTPRLAARAVREFKSARKRGNLVIGDFPGRVTDMTKTLCSQADAAIAVTNDSTSVARQIRQKE